MYDNCTCVLGLPNALGGYDETPEIMAGHLKVHACIYAVAPFYLSVVLLSYMIQGESTAMPR